MGNAIPELLALDRGQELVSTWGLTTLITAAIWYLVFHGV
jgi:hypothetical protein